jgi:hypothetical protein
VLLSITCNNCETSVHQKHIFAEKSPTKYFSFFKEGLILEKGKPDLLYAEVSAVTFDGKNLIFGNEDFINEDPESNDLSKIISPIFEMSYTGFPNTKIIYYQFSDFINARKIEDLTILQENSGSKYVIATTAFDRVHFTGSAEWDNFNTLLIWPVGKPNEVKVVDPSLNDGVKSSMNIRKRLFEALGKPEVKYLKVEGITVLPNNKLLFGIREYGDSYEKFDYSITIIAANYTFENNNLRLSDFELVFDLDPKTKETELGYIVGLSSLEYDWYNHRLYMLTSYEKDVPIGKRTYDDIGAFLWILTTDKTDIITDVKLVLEKGTSKPLIFNHKAEGIAVINKSEIFIVHDDDEILTSKKESGSAIDISRKHNQSAYTIVNLLK